MFNIDKSLKNIMGTNKSRILNNIMGDKDRDGVINGLDCQPNNRFKQGPGDNNIRNEYHKKAINKWRYNILALKRTNLSMEQYEKAKQQYEDEIKKHQDAIEEGTW